MITREKKEKIVEDMVGTVKDSESVVFCDFSGLGTGEINELKSSLRSNNMGYKVTKKSLWPIVLKKAGLEDAEISFKDHLGSVSMAYSKDDGVIGAKVIDSFAKTHKQFVVLGGLIEKMFVGPDKIKQLALLPSREELLAKFVFVLNWPRQGFVSVLGANVRNLVSVFDNIRSSKE